MLISYRIGDKSWATFEPHAQAVYEKRKENYARRNQTNKGKIINDIITGKAGELAVHLYLKEKGIETTFPDFEVYDKPNWNADLKIIKTGVPIHVKSQSTDMSKEFGLSWTFQLGNNRNTGFDCDDILLKPSGLICFAQVDFSKKLVHVYAILEAKRCIDKCLQHPLLPKFRNIKWAVYYQGGPGPGTPLTKEFKELCYLDTQAGREKFLT